MKFTVSYKFKLKMAQNLSGRSGISSKILRRYLERISIQVRYDILKEPYKRTVIQEKK